MMLSGASYQHAIAIFMICFFGLQFGAAAIDLLYKLYKYYKRTGIRFRQRRRGLLRLATAEDSAGILKELEEIKENIKEGNASTAERLNGIQSDVSGIRTQLRNAGRQAYIWNITSLVCGLFGVAIGILTR